MDGAIVDIFDQCIARLEAGASSEECLAAYPQQRAELEPPLLLAASLRQLPRPAMPATTRAALEAQMLAQAAARRAAQGQAGSQQASRSAPRSGWQLFTPTALLAGVLRLLGYRGSLAGPWMRLASAALALVLALVLGVGAFAAARTLVDVIAPRATPAPTSAPPTSTAAPAAFTLDGIVERIDQEGWLVASKPVAIDAHTAISGTPMIGAVAHIRGTARADGTLLAAQIRIDPPTATPTPIPATSPPATLAPTSAPPTVAPTDPPPSATPAPKPPAQPGNGNGARGSDDKEHTCRGLELGKDEKKCDPQRPAPHPSPKEDKGNKRKP